MREGFLKKFIEEERYLQNPPLRTKDFIDFCKKRGVETNTNELEFFEKEGLLYPILRSENPRNSLGSHIYIPISFQNFEKDLIRQLFKENKIIDPSKIDFKPYSTFKDKELKFGNERVSNYYSSFQIHWLIILKESYSFNINLANEKMIVSSSLARLNGFEMSWAFRIGNFKDFEMELEKASNDYVGKLIFNFENKKKELLKMYLYFEKILEFLLSIQSIYAPYGRSSSRRITLKGDDENWHEVRNKFNPKEELNELKFTIDEVEALYHIFSKKTPDLLGIKRDDWIQLWKSLAWNEKDKLEGNIRLGIEYLQWSLMLKRFIEDYMDREILDIDELGSIPRNEIYKI